MPSGVYPRKKKKAAVKKSEPVLTAHLFIADCMNYEKTFTGTLGFIKENVKDYIEDMVEEQEWSEDDKDFILLFEDKNTQFIELEERRVEAKIRAKTSDDYVSGADLY